MSAGGIQADQGDGARIFSIGHSDLALGRFILLLQVHDVDVLVDVRSHPYSKWVAHFNRRNLRTALQAKGIKYGFLGKELGGKPDSNEFYDTNGHVLYDVLSESAPFKRGIQRLKKGVQKHRLAIMCSEEDPRDCHRRLLIGRVLEGNSLSLFHIRADGRLQPEEGFESDKSENVQLSMLAPKEGEILEGSTSAREADAGLILSNS